jgi:hypothetical protein
MPLQHFYLSVGLAGAVFSWTRLQEILEFGGFLQIFARVYYRKASRPSPFLWYFSSKPSHKAPFLWDAAQ